MTVKNGFILTPSVCVKIPIVPGAVFYVLQPTKGETEEKFSLVEQYSSTSKMEVKFYFRPSGRKQ